MSEVSTSDVRGSQDLTSSCFSYERTQKHVTSSDFWTLGAMVSIGGACYSHDF